jgi:hypothetical protein
MEVVSSHSTHFIPVISNMQSGLRAKMTEPPSLSLTHTHTYTRVSVKYIAKGMPL